MSLSSISDNTVHVDCNDNDNEYYMFAGSDSCLEEFIVLNKCGERDEFLYDTLDVDATELDFSGKDATALPKSKNQIDPIPAPTAIRFQSSKEQLDKLDLMAEDETETDKDAKWSALVEKLNVLGPARSTQNWKRIWAARKYNLKRSASQKRKLETSTEKLDEPMTERLVDCVERSEKSSICVCAYAGTSKLEEPKRDRQVDCAERSEKSSICVCACAAISKLEEAKRDRQVDCAERSEFVGDTEKSSSCAGTSKLEELKRDRQIDCLKRSEFVDDTSNIFPIIVEKLDVLINLMRTSNSLLSKLVDK